MRIGIERMLAAALLLPLTAQAQQSIGVVLSVIGEASARDERGAVRRLQRRAEIFEHDTVVTGVNGYVILRMADESSISLRRETEFTFEQYRFDADPATPDLASMTLIRGCFRAVSGSIGRSSPADVHRIDTPLASVDVHGAFHGAAYDGSEVYTETLDGGTTVSNAQGSIELGMRGAYDFSRTLPGAGPVGQLSRAAQPQPEFCGDGRNTPTATNASASNSASDYASGTLLAPQTDHPTLLNPSAAP